MPDPCDQVFAGRDQKGFSDISFLKAGGSVRFSIQNSNSGVVLELEFGPHHFEEAIIGVPRAILRDREEIVRLLNSRLGNGPSFQNVLRDGFYKASLTASWFDIGNLFVVLLG